MKGRLLPWMPPALLAAGAVFTVGVDLQRSLPLRVPLAEVIPTELAGHRGTDVSLSDQELRVAGVSSYALRTYGPADSGTRASAVTAFTIYVGYYDSQMQGKTAHSPKNCLPGAGWQALASREVAVGTPAGMVPVNRYLLQRDDDQALVLYWYQGRGRAQANEYRVKWDLLRDAATRGRSEEALVRIVVPVTAGEEAAFELAATVARHLVPAVYRALPT